MKITVHTRSGKKLTYSSEFKTAKEAKTWWMYAINDSSSAVSFGRFTIISTQIDYVEVFP